MMKKSERLFMKNLKNLAVIFILLGLGACAGSVGSSHSVRRQGAPATPEMQQQFYQCESYYKQSLNTEALMCYQSYAQNYASNENTDEARYKEGKIHFINKNYSLATLSFLELSRLTPDNEYRAKGLHMAGYSQVKAQDFVNALETLKQVDEEKLPVNLRIQLYSLIAQMPQLSISQEDHVIALLKLYDTYIESSANVGQKASLSVMPMIQVESDLVAWAHLTGLENQMTPAILKYRAKSAKPFVSFKQAKEFLAQGNSKKASSLLQNILRDYPASPMAQASADQLKNLNIAVIEQNVKNIQPFRVGMLISTGGPYDGHSRELLDGLRCGIGEEARCGAVSGITVIVKDIQNDSQLLRQAITELKDQNVTAIVGPLSAELSQEASSIASQYNIPIFPITQKEGLMKQGRHVFQVGLTPELQMEKLAISARQQNLKRVAMLYPDMNYGRTLANLFSYHFKKLGGAISHEIIYNPKTNDWYAEARRLAERTNPAEGQKLPFDAIFIPDSYININSVAQALASQDISGIPLLGTTAWNDPGLGFSAIALDFPKSFFIDAYNPSAQDAEVIKFKQIFKTGFGRDPRLLSAYGYDLGLLLKDLGQKNGPAGIRSALESGQGYHGATGLRGFVVGDRPVIETKTLFVTENGVGE